MHVILGRCVQLHQVSVDNWQSHLHPPKLSTRVSQNLIANLLSWGKKKEDFYEVTYLLPEKAESIQQRDAGLGSDVEGKSQSITDVWHTTILPPLTEVEQHQWGYRRQEWIAVRVLPPCHLNFLKMWGPQTFVCTIGYRILKVEMYSRNNFSYNVFLKLAHI